MRIERNFEMRYIGKSPNKKRRHLLLLKSPNLDAANIKSLTVHENIITTKNIE